MDRRASRRLRVCGAALVAATLCPPAPRAVAQCELEEFVGTPRINDQLGRSVAIHGDLAVAVDTLLDTPGYAEVYRRQGSAWIQEATVTAEVAGCEQSLAGCATSGDVIAVGDQLACAGAVYVFRHDAGAWPLETILTASDGQPGDAFGRAVDIDGNVLLIGAPRVGPDQGAAYIFRYDGASWVEEARLTDPNRAAEDVFGWDVAVSGDVALIGGHGNNQIKGAAFVFRRQGKAWVLEEELEAWDNPTFQVRFGWSVDVVGSTVAIGAPANIGSVYLFELDGTAWQPHVKLTGSMPVGIGPWFGSDVALGEEADIMLVGANQDYAAGFEAGAAYLFRREPEWVEVSKFVAADTDGADLFGGAVGLSGDTAIIGAHGNNSTGKVYFFAGMSGADCNANGAPDGCDIAGAVSRDADGNGVPDECEVPGDANGDGIVDVLGLVEVILAWGPCLPPCLPACDADVTADCTVGVEDLALVVGQWTGGG